MKLIDKAKAWYVVRTNVRSEEKAASNLRAAGFDHYLPLQRFEKWNKRTNTYLVIERPLLVGYLFVGLPIGGEHFGFVRACDGVDSVLGDHDNHPIRVASKIVEDFQIAETDMQFDDTRVARKHRAEALDKQFSPGLKVLVRKLESALNGYEATVLETNGEDRVRISLGSGSTWVRPEDIAAA